MRSVGRLDAPLAAVNSPAVALARAEEWERVTGERRMVAGVLRWLIRARWLGAASQAAFEVPFRGRRIDLVTVNGDGRIAAFEFKLGGTGRVFEQAIYNQGSAHRSYVVSDGQPGEPYRELAASQGLGIFIVNGSTRLLQRPSMKNPEPDSARSLRAAFRRVSLGDV